MSRLSASTRHTKHWSDLTSALISQVAHILQLNSKQQDALKDKSASTALHTLIQGMLAHIEATAPVERKQLFSAEQVTDLKQLFDMLSERIRQQGLHVSDTTRHFVDNIEHLPSSIQEAIALHNSHRTMHSSKLMPPPPTPTTPAIRRSMPSTTLRRAATTVAASTTPAIPRSKPGTTPHSAASDIDLAKLFERPKVTIVYPGEDPRTDETIVKIHSAATKYLAWMNKNASGTRYLTRWRHLSHGASGVKRVQHIVNLINNRRRFPTYILDATLKAFQQSSRADRSFSRFLYAEFGGDNAISDQYKHYRKEYHQACFKPQPDSEYIELSEDPVSQYDYLKDWANENLSKVDLFDMQPRPKPAARHSMSP